MNFTREPIIETVITARDGCKLVLRNSKSGGDEEYHVEAVEIVSFGRSFFFRSIENEKPFLFPVTDYEILESKEVRMALKNVQSDRQIKIGGGREAQLRPQVPQKRDTRRPEANPEDSEFGSSMQPQDRKQQGVNRRRRGRRGGRGGDRPHEMPGHHADNHAQHSQADFSEENASALQKASGGEALESAEAAPKAPSFISKLFPPPPTLIKETLSRYKPSEEAETSEEKQLPFEKTTFDDPISNENDEDNLEDV